MTDKQYYSILGVLLMIAGEVTRGQYSQFVYGTVAMIMFMVALFKSSKNPA